MRVNIYLPDRGGAQLRREATTLAKDDGLSFSGLVATLLREYVQRKRRAAARKAGS